MSGSKRNLMETTGLARVVRRVKGFRRDEGGTMLVFGLTIFVMMLWAGGMAIDFMRFEHRRAHMQYTLDRAALAAASLNNTLDCEAVARDYFEKADLADTNFAVRGDCQLLDKTVKIAAETEVKSFFLNLLGIPTLLAGAESTASETDQDIEISLVLDVSGSMGSLSADGNKTKLEALQEATAGFFDILLVPGNEDRVSINVIPYNMQVNAGEDVMDMLNTTSEHDYSHCVDFDTDDFSTVEISSAIGSGGGGANLGDLSITDGTGGVMGTAPDLQRTGHFDPFFQTRNHPNISSDDGNTRHFVCPITPFSQVMLMSQNKDALNAKINSFEAGGNTSTDIGVKWGSYFLNPSANVLIGGLPADSTVFSAIGAPTDNGDGTFTPSPRELPAAFADRPLPYARNNTLKYLIVMSDGKNTTQYTLDEDFASGPSDLWWDRRPDVGDPERAIWDAAHPGNSGTWLSHFLDISGDNDFFISRGSSSNDYFSSTRRHQDHDEQLDWPEVWAMMGVKHYSLVYFFYRDWDADSYFDKNDEIMDYIFGSTKNTRMLAACAAAEDEGVRIFTIGFEVSSASGELLQDCASANGDYFPVSGDEITAAFGSIANTIQRLKLTN